MDVRVDLELAASATSSESMRELLRSGSRAILGQALEIQRLASIIDELRGDIVVARLQGTNP